MEIRKVNSSAIAGIGYDPDEKKMIVEFHSGRKFVYEGVPPSVYDDFLGAKSLGVFFARNIRGKYGAEKL
jgi:hypothetical protein